MGPSEVQEWLDFEPFMPARLTLASGTIVDIRQREGVSVNGLSLSIVDAAATGELRLRLVSIPNIAMIEPIADLHGSTRLSGDE